MLSDWQYMNMEIAFGDSFIFQQGKTGVLRSLIQVEHEKPFLLCKTKIYEKQIRFMYFKCLFISLRTKIEKYYANFLSEVREQFIKLKPQLSYINISFFRDTKRRRQISRQGCGSSRRMGNVLLSRHSGTSRKLSIQSSHWCWYVN